MEMRLDYEARDKGRLTREQVLYLLVIRCLAIYFVTSAVTLPLIDSLWAGELPVLALIQLPKTVPAAWLRTQVVMAAIRALGLSRGSFSPDYALAGPYALAIVYLIPLTLFSTAVTMRARMTRPLGWWLGAMWLAAWLDFVFTLSFARGPGLTIY